ncbi:uncharacterized protein MKK02DRAFT_38103 [Dioszegia hungarica]|uniref:Protein transporter SEC24 n=1 Tax=Dioszegia hungarica TaxID=4972 RepID=A0AA38LTI4_9TREE|nr:uncharacterized protein MKK02DRAFT_38103 [Dioszegia hungarica]KAI9633449.1 hypothetical protein MKK02DRAFT_38103 [Dioszegia hungarica]
MPPRSRYAVDPSLTAQGGQGTQPNYQQPQQAEYQQGHQQANLQTGYDQQQQQQYNGAPTQQPSGPYDSTAPRERSYAVHRPEPAVQPNVQSMHPSLVQPMNHIPPPPHSSGPSISGPRVRIDPSQVPNPVEAQEMDQNLYDEEDFLSCQTKGVIPLAGTDYRGVDQGNSLPRHLRVTLPVAPSNSQLLDTTALPFGVIVQPFAQLRYDEAPIPLVSNWVSGQSAFDQPQIQDAEEEGPPRCEKCRGYINPFVRFVDGGRRWGCNLCGQTNEVHPTYYSSISPSGHRLDHSDRPELLHGTVDFPVPKMYWAVQPASDDTATGDGPDIAAATASLTSAASDMLGGLTASLGQTPAVTRGNSPAPGFKEKEKERLKAEARLRRPVPISRVFVLDVSDGAVKRGVLRYVCEGIRRGLYGTKRKSEGDSEDGEEEEGIGAGERVAIITVAESVGFWNLSAGSSGPSLMVVSDLEDMFVPLRDGFLVDPVESRSQIEGLLNMLPDMMERQSDGGRCAIGAAIKGALAGLRRLGGQITFFLTSLPLVGPGKLTSRDDPTVYNTDKERALFTAADPFWRNTADEIANAGVGVNTFLFPDQYTDVASVGALSAATGGDVFFHPRFEPVRDRDTLFDEIRRSLTTELVYNATMRVRCSNNLRVGEHYGDFHQRSLTDLEFGTIGESAAIGAVIKYEGKLDEKDLCYVQVAVLYTSIGGERRVRVLNTSMGVTGLVGNVFRFSDLDASVTLYAKEAVSLMPSKQLKDIRKMLTDRCNRVLLMYRRHCAGATQQGQLILPETFKLLPLYTLCLLKSKPLKGGTVTSDVRSHYMRRLRSYGVVSTMTLLYPRLLAIHDLTDDVGFPAGPMGRLKMPSFMRASYGWMVAEGAYLMTNGETAMIWLGGAVSPQVIDDLWGVDNPEELDTRMTRLPKLPTLLSTQIRNLLAHFERIMGHPLPLLIIRQNMDGMELEYANHLVEDSNNDALSYTDYLMTSHKSITNEMSGGGGKGDSWRPW